MKPHSLIIDDFLYDFDGWRAWADTAQYETITNPVDHVAYPGICKTVPDYGVRQRLSLILGAPVHIRTLFLRLSLFGVQVPHFAHTDAVMGQYSLMLYLNRSEDCQGGTALVRHRMGLDCNPGNAEEEELWMRDTNKALMWVPYMTCEMRPNRAFIFRADLMHAALPLGGFGSDAANGRLVLTAFFDL